MRFHVGKAIAHDVIGMRLKSKHTIFEALHSGSNVLNSCNGSASNLLRLVDSVSKLIRRSLYHLLLMPRHAGLCLPDCATNGRVDGDLSRLSPMED